MRDRTVDLILAGASLLLMAAFTLGLAHAISTGFAGFWGGLPFLVIALTVLAMAIYDIWHSCIRR